ncbi:MAG: class I SAM-dependent methyltransferase [Vicinamibacteria bacterium]|nr:class I SAM-dependent methyltransferase [Vicinamibacteria bacterium]
MSTPRFELSPTTRFADRASDYALFRPSYPKEAVDFALDGLSVACGLVAADIGAGTGISSRLLADRGVSVFAVEPNAGMRESAEPHPGVSFIDGSAEATGLDRASVDLVLCAQAFHWFRPAEALTEFWRILRSDGRLAFLVNERDAEAPATRAYGAALSASVDRELSEGMRDPIDEALRVAGRIVVPMSFPSAQTLTHGGLIGRARSASYAPKDGPRYEALIRDLDRLWEAHKDAGGLISLHYRTLVWRVNRAERR